MGLKTTTEAIAPSDPKLLKMLKGKVIDVNNKWDFVVLSIGSNTTIDQNKVNIPLNQDMIVVRGLNEATPEYVGKVKIVQINDNCSIANIIPESEGKQVQIGDTVYFSNATIQALTPVKQLRGEKNMFSSKLFTGLSVLALVILIAAVVFQALEMQQYELFKSIIDGKI
eukprot:TRINITY_DN16518_c0_g4_i1.p1 TRINITY_DN16518_c0_g4~~TRINITY_DN16518_c0_g4_i1.p1  ORF type:complete len:194 (-),score=41.78 TRINITY_DN16518_c0_g4_i1:445-951(-)